MKAPDNKLYVTYTSVDGIGGVYSASNEDNGGSEYIRKDVILKWTKEQEDKLEYGIAAEAYKLALDMLREKLNSL